MIENLLHEIALALKQDWELTMPDTLPEEDIIKLLAEKVINILQRGPEPFYQLMYRLDISEKKLNAVLNDEDAPTKIARLIYDRQLQKIKSRHEHRRTMDLRDGELKW